MDHVPRLENFLKNQKYTFAGVDIRGDRRVLGLEKLYTPPANHVDIQDMYWKKGLGGPKAGMATMAAKLIDPNNKEMACQSFGNNHALSQSARVSHFCLKDVR